MAKAASDTITELILRLQLEKVGLRLQRSSGISYQVMYRKQVLLSGNVHGEALTLSDIASFLRKSRVLP